MEPQTYVAFVGTYPPRRCGIATFTRDLAAGMSAASARIRPLAVAVTEEGGEYEYPDEVVPPGSSPTRYLAELAWVGAAERYPGGVPE